MVAGCGRADVADLLVAAWLTSTAAAGVFEAKKMQEVMLLLQLGTEDSQELNRGCCSGAGRAARDASHMCSGRPWAGERVCCCWDGARARAMACVCTSVSSFAVAGLGCSALFVCDRARSVHGPLAMHGSGRA